MLARSILPIVQTALNIAPIVLLKGARQVGKSTLAMTLDRHYRVLDDVSTRILAKENPSRFIETIPKPATIDEIQKAPELLEALKLYIDQHRHNGDFLLTGSANILDMKAVKDTLAGRIIELALYPLSCKEKNGKPDDNIIDRLFNNDVACPSIDTDRIVTDILFGGYPDVQHLHQPLERKLWFASYISTYVERDARDLGDFRSMDSFFRLVNILAPRSTALLNKTKLSKEVGVRTETIENYLVILEQTYQITLLRPFYENIGKQFVKSPKMFLNDTGVMSYFLGLYRIDGFDTSPYKGELVETFVLNELLKHITFAEENTRIFHYATHDQKEIDFILERNDTIIAIEVKASSKIDRHDCRHIIDYQNRSEKTILGILFYLGKNVLHIDDRCVALPIGYFY